MSITDRVERIRLNYVNSKPAISYERARIWTESHKRTEGQPVAIRRAQAFYDTCNERPGPLRNDRRTACFCQKRNFPLLGT